MAKSPKPKPSFDRSAPAAKTGMGWMQRSDTDAAPAAPAAVVVAAVVVAPRAVARREPTPMRFVSPIEQGVALLSKPFGLAVALGISVLSLVRKPGAMLGLLLVAGGLSMGGCRAQEIWSGAEIDEDKGRVKLASEEPLCGCLTIANISGKDIKLKSMFHDTSVGEALVKANEKLTFRYDWAGHDNTDLYEIVTTSATDEVIPAKTAVRIDARSYFMECGTAMCPVGDLKLTLGMTGQ